MKQRNPNSVNLQFVKCNKVEISKLYANEKIQSEQLTKILSEPTDRMLTVIFDVIKTRNGKEAQTIAVDLLGGQVVNSTVWVNIPDSRVLENSKAVKLLCKYVQHLKNTRAYFRNRPIKLYQFARKISDIRTCGLSCSANCEFLSKGKNGAGWSCQFVNVIKRRFGKEKFSIANTYWYNLGHFNEQGEWVIDKEMIKSVIFNQITSEGIDLCPNFPTKRILEEIQQLPDTIVVDNIHFRNQYRKDFFGNKLAIIPENIVHIPSLSDYEKQEYEKALKIKELEYLIGMGKLSGRKLQIAKEQLLVLNGIYQSYARKFVMDVHPEAGYRYSDN